MSTPIAFLTGGSRGIGRNTAIHLARRGMDVIFTWHSREAEAAEVVALIEAEGRRGVALQLDTGDTSALPGFLSRFRAALHTLGA
ncbi:SDR family NAD(P)-dependent oxidoreductase, partial [Thioclava sp. BHET1]